MADPVIPNGAATVTLDINKTLTVKTAANASVIVAIFTGSTLDLKETLAANATKSYGPYTVAKTVRFLPLGGSVTYSISSDIASLPQPAQAVVSPDGKTVSGVGAKPNTPVVVYFFDTGVLLGQTNSLADGTWSLTNLRVPLSAGDKVGYDLTMVGPVTTVGAILAAPGQVIGLTLGTTSTTSQAMTWAVPVDAGAPDDYLVEYRKTGDTTYQSVVSSDTSETVSGLTPATPYQFRVTARNAQGAGTPSALQSKSTSAATPTSTPGQISTDLSDPNSVGPKV